MNKILVITVESMGGNTGADTMPELLKQYDRNKIANIFIRSNNPDINICKSFLHISEGAVMKSVFKRNAKTAFVMNMGTEATEISESIIEAEQKRYAFFKRVNLWIFKYAREIIWKLGKWKSRELDEFIEEFAPDVIFFSVEGLIYYNNICEYIVKKTNAIGIGFLWDDNFSYKNSNNLFFKLHRFFLRKSVKRLISCCSTVFSISPKMKREADAEFGVNSILLTKPVEAREVEICQPKAPYKLLYTGKLYAGREYAMVEIVKALNEVNANGKIFDLSIYSPPVSDKKIQEFLISSGVMKGFVDQAELKLIQGDTDILLFVEALGGKNCFDARLSFSTKLTDYFSSGKCIFAVGSAELAPIEYLSENDIAIVAHSNNEIKSQLQFLIQNPDKILNYGAKSLEFGRKFHNGDEIRKRLYAILNQK